MTSTPSQQLAEQLHVTPPADLAEWFDDDCPSRCVGSEFDDALSVTRILDPQPGELWGGFMPPDLLPVLGNRYGDWICLRLDFAGTVKDWVLWRHGGGDWTIIGRSFCEALVYEAVLARNEDGPSATRPATTPVASTAAAWALDWLAAQGNAPADPERFFDPDREARRDAMLAWTSSPATYRDIAAARLDCPFRRLATPTLAASIQTAWEPDFVRWTFDPALLPEAAAEQIRQQLESDDADLFQQDWDGAEAAALAAAEMTDELGWPFEVAGWAAERRGDLSLAEQRYRKAIRCSAFTDDSVLFRTHWFNCDFGKFSAERLHALAVEPSDPYLSLLVRGQANIHSHVADFWFQQAEEAERLGDWTQAYEFYWKAGWDIGFMPLERLPALFDSVAHAAERADAPGLARLARLHHRFVWKG